MSTPFGEVLEKDAFQKSFSVVILISTIIAAVMNSFAVWRLGGNLWIVWLLGILYVAMGISTIKQHEIMEKWRNKKLERLIGIYSCFFIYDILILLIWLILTVLFKLSGKIRVVGVFVLDGLAAVIVLFGYLHAKRIKYTSYSIPLALRGRKWRIAMMSDIHLGAFVEEKHIRCIVDKINRLNPDLVVICGDIIDVNNHILDDDDALGRISSVFREIHAKEGVFAVLGNHDPKADNKRFVDFLAASHIQLLHDQVIQMENFNLAGRTDASNNRRRAMEYLSREIKAGLPTIVLDHNPAGIPEAGRFGADLVLSGHTHKGQFFPVTYFTKLANGKHYFYGHEQFGKMHAIISSGAGYFQLPVRVGTSNEIVDLHIS